MGLDMYLNAKRYLSKHFDATDETKQKLIHEIFPELVEFDSELVKEVTIEAGYWRKANAIHKWFVDNVQDGADDCGDYYVSRTDLEALKSACEAVLADKTKAVEILPTKAGFFFGQKEYNEWYFQDIETTIRIIDRALKLPDSWDFEYHSSW